MGTVSTTVPIGSGSAIGVAQRSTTVRLTLAAPTTV